jgi:hypothetical protein
MDRKPEIIFAIRVHEYDEKLLDWLMNDAKTLTKRIVIVDEEIDIRWEPIRTTPSGDKDFYLYGDVFNSWDESHRFGFLRISQSQESYVKISFWIFHQPYKQIAVSLFQEILERYHPENPVKPMLEDYDGGDERRHEIHPSGLIRNGSSQPGRPSDQAYDKAYSLVKQGESLVVAYNASVGSLELPKDKYLWEAFKAAIRRRRRKDELPTK